MLYFLKVVISALLIVTITETSKRSSFIGALLASLPLVSLLAILWLYWETKDIQKIAELSIGIFWLVLASLPFFVVFPILLKNKYHFYVALSSAIILMFISYGLLTCLLKVFK